MDSSKNSGISKKRKQEKRRLRKLRRKMQTKIWKKVTQFHSTNILTDKVVKRVLKLLGDLSIEDIPEYEEGGNFFQDLDLIVLGSSAEDYRKYTELIRKEYSYLNEADYKKMRLKGETHNGRKLIRKIVPDNKNSNKRSHRQMNRVIEHHRKKYKAKSKNIAQVMSSGNWEQNVNIIRSQIGNQDASHNSSENFDCYIVEKNDEIIVINDDEDEPTSIDCCNDSDMIVSNCNEDENSEQFPKIFDPMIIENDLMSHWATKGISDPLNTLTLTSKDLTKETLSSDVPILEDRSGDVKLKSICSDTTILSADSLVEDKDISKQNESVDDSVIFVNEQIDLENFKPIPKALDYIPLSDLNDDWNVLGVQNTNQIGNTHAIIKRSRKKTKNSVNASTNSGKLLFSSYEKKQIQIYSTNAYNPNKEQKSAGKRMVIIDGSNIAYAHSLNKAFSVKGLEICISYFEKMGHEVKAVVPQNRLQKDKSTDPEKLEKLHRAGKIVFTPCKNLPGKSSTSYDDRFILQLAVEFDAAIISNDNYRDLIHENIAFKKLIENRVVGYTWCNDMFILPKDPYGRNGPSLSVILNHT